MAPRAWPLVACLGVALTLAPAGVSVAQDAPPRRVRLELQDGTVVEGRLEAFAGRVYRVITADGKTREVAERDVARVAFDASRPPTAGTPTACAALAEALRRAEASGALASRVLGKRHLLLTEVSRNSPEEAGEERRFLLAVEVRKEKDALVVELEVPRKPGTGRRDPRLFDVDADGAPFRLRYVVDLASGRTLRGDAVAGKKELAMWRAEEEWHVRLRDGERGGARAFRPTTCSRSRSPSSCSLRSTTRGSRRA